MTYLSIYSLPLNCQFAYSVPTLFLLHTARLLDKSSSHKKQPLSIIWLIESYNFLTYPLDFFASIFLFFY